jgi:hypothetical protein
LRDEEFDLGRIDYLFRTILGVDTKQITTRIVGPYSSITLGKMLEEVAKPANKQGPLVLEKVEMWSPTATAEDKILLRGVPGLEACANVEQALSATINPRLGSFNFKRAIRTDGEVMQKLVDELQTNRRLDLYKDGGKEGNDRVVLISEWDTLFGRALPWSFRRAVVSSGSSDATKPLSGAKRPNA